MVQQQELQVLRRQWRSARHRRWWCQPWLLRKPAFWQFEQLIVELKVEDLAAFQNFVRFELAMFQKLVDRLTTLINKTNTNCYKALDPDLKLAITLRYLATGDSSKSLQYGFRVAYYTICLLIPDVCHWYINNTTDWIVVDNQMIRRWQYHHCLGDIWWQACCHMETKEGWILLFQLQEFSLNSTDGPGGWVDVGSNGPSSDAHIYS